MATIYRGGTRYPSSSAINDNEKTNKNTWSAEKVDNAINGALENYQKVQQTDITDLDNLTTDGIYTFNGALLDNIDESLKASDGKIYGIITVTHYGNNDISQIAQSYIAGKYNVSSRRFYSGNETWGNWEKLATQSDLEKLCTKDLLGETTSTTTTNLITLSKSINNYKFIQVLGVISSSNSITISDFLTVDDFKNSFQFIFANHDGNRIRGKYQTDTTMIGYVQNNNTSYPLKLKVYGVY